MRAWADTLTRYDVPLQPALDLLDGVEMDIRGDTYETFDQLRLYCYRVAGAAGLLMALILGYAGPEALDAAVDLGIAMQLTNILRDLGEDARRGRVYLPADELAAFGYPRDALERGERTPAFYDLMRFQIARAEDYYQRGLRGVALLDADARLAIALSGRPLPRDPPAHPPQWLRRLQPPRAHLHGGQAGDAPRRLAARAPRLTPGVDPFNREKALPGATSAGQNRSPSPATLSRDPLAPQGRGGRG